MPQKSHDQMNQVGNFRLGLLLLTAAALASVARCQLTADEKVVVLQYLNYLRKSTVPKAADMNALLWDATLESLAQRAADSCIFAHNYLGEYASLGETLYRGGSRDCKHILTFMFLERENYDFKTGQCNPVKYPQFTTCGHYLQIVSAGISKVGCGIQLCSGSNLMACEFDRQYTSPPYQTGQPGTKCGNALAAYYQDGLCYWIPYGQPPPVPGPFQCLLSCLNYGTLLTAPVCACICQSGCSGIRCETKNTAVSTVVNDCTAQAVTCKNGGTPTMFDTLCKCVCPATFRGDSCEENIQQTGSSIFVYFGGQAIYQSYYPVDVKLWSGTDLRSRVEKNLTKALNDYCSANLPTCCPYSSQAVDSFVSAGDFHDTDNYPAQDLDGTMVAAVYYTLSATVAPICVGSVATPAYVTKAILTEACKQAEPAIKLIAADFGLQVVRVN